MRSLHKFKNLIFTMLLATLLISAVGFALLPTNSALAATSTDVSLYLPKTNLEYKALTSPIDVYHDGNVTAIVHGDALSVYKDGEYKKDLTNFLNVKQVKKADANTLWVLASGSIYPVNLNTMKSSLALIDNSNNTIGGNYFDLNDDYLVTAFSTGGSIYRRASDTSVYVRNFTLDGDKPVAINENNQIFYVQGGIYTVGAESGEPQKISDAVPAKMIADNENVYYLLNDSNKVYKLNIKDNSVTQLTASAPDYELGNLVYPTGLSFNAKNLLVTDGTLNAVQEFEIADSSLVFTGFAVALNKTAYNRISTTATDIEKYGDKIAVLDRDKLTVITDADSNQYSPKNYKNYIQNSSFDDKLQHFALGKDKILYSTTDTTVNLLDLNAEENNITQISLPLTGTLVDDITYQSGTFYLLAHNSTSSVVYSLSENSAEYALIEIIKQTASNYGEVAVDVFKNVYISNDLGVHKYENASGSYEKTNSITASNVQKLTTDLGGKIYFLANGSIKTYNGSSIKDVTPAPYTAGAVIKSFAMNFDKKEVYLLYSNHEYICESLALENYALSEATVLDGDYVITGANADIDKLKLACAKEGANVYSVNKNNDKFDFIGLTASENEYAYICDVNFDTSLTLCALVGENGFVLINKDELSFPQIVKDTAPKKAFVTTSVNAYFIPLITKDAEFKLDDNGRIRLQKQSEISPISKITAFGKDFYYAQVYLNGKTYQGYVPVDFTVELLSKDVEWQGYEIEKVNKTTLYKDANCTEVIIELNKNTSLQVASRENGVAKVLIEAEGGYIEGYIKEDAIINQPKTSIINVIIIMGVTVCVCATALFFILKKKK